ncbi:MAG: flagellar basal body-associated FliL family protein [Fimbriimonadaceae bacterium]
MSEAAAEPKKKGKLPVILALVVVLFGGGFFGMKMKGGGKKVEPAIKLAHGEKAVVEIEEKLYNLADRETFMRTTMALHPKDGYEVAKIAAQLPAIEDAILRVVCDKMPDEVVGSKNIAKLKVEIAESINHLLEAAEEEHAKEGGKEESKEKPKEHSKDEKPEHPDWDSQTGPILKVYFKALAIQ